MDTITVEFYDSITGSWFTLGTTEFSTREDALHAIEEHRSDPYHGNPRLRIRTESIEEIHANII